MQRRALWLMTMLAVACTSQVARATEGGGGAYPNGAEGFMTGALPPPGYYLIDYNLYYTADTLMDASGNAIDVVPDAEGNLVDNPFDLQVCGTIPRLVNVTKTKFLGGHWAQHVFVPLLYVDVTAPDGTQDDNFGLGDIIVDPVILGWRRGNMFMTAGCDVFVPVGDYEVDQLANLGRNYWTFEPVVACTYLEKGVEVSAKAMYDINLENDDTKVKSGDEFHVDGAVGVALNKKWKVGVSGYYYQQMGNDEADGVEIEDSEGMTMAAGPALSYQMGKINVVGKYQTEFDTENRPEGDKVWVNLVMPL